MKRILIITYYWPPSGGAGVQRWLKFAKYLPEFGWHPTIFTPENPEAPAIDGSLLKDISDKIEVIKTPIWEPYTFYKKFTGKKKSEKINAGFIQEKNTNKLLENISTFIRGNFFIPDARKFWIKPSVNYLKKYLIDNPVDVIISTGPPHSMHLIALELKKQLGVKWIADFRDPWTNIDFYSDLKLTKSSDNKHKKLEKEVLSIADCVISVGNTLSQELKSLGANRISTISNGFDTDDIPSIKPKLGDKFSIAHVGSINKDRDHEAFWKALQIACSKLPKFKENLEIKFIGKVDISTLNQIKIWDLEDNFNHMEYMPHDKIINELMKAQILYLPINNTPNAKGILTGKFFEYLAAKRPILAIGLEESDIAEILNEVDAGKVFDFKNFQGVSNFLNEKFSEFIKNEIKIIDNKVDKYSRKQLTKQLAELITDIDNE